MRSQLNVRHLGLMDYPPVWHAMQQLTVARTEQDKDEIWLLQHFPVFTQGQAGKPEHLLAPADIPVVEVDRGGQVTYHGPGQLVVYLLLDIRRMGIGPRELVTRIENSLVTLLSKYGIDAHPKANAPGVYIGDAKIASLGLRIKKGCSFHGLSLNIDMDLEPFHRINPCGYAGLSMTQLSDFVPGCTIDDVAEKLLDLLQVTFGYEDIQTHAGLPMPESAP